jgi:hypothetical protein
MICGLLKRFVNQVGQFSFYAVHQHRSYTTALNSKFMEILPDSQKNELRRACFLPLPSEQTALPDSNVLRAQMLGIARESRLAGKLSDECVMVLSNALEVIISNAP